MIDRWLSIHALRLAGCCWLVLIVYWRISAFGVKRTLAYAQSPLRRFVISFSLVLGIGLLFARPPWLALLGPRILPNTVLVHAVGLATCALGVAFAIWARVVLAGNWSGHVTLKENHTLVQNGPYAIVRHPIYTGILAAMLGTAIVVGEVRGAVAMLGFIGILFKMDDEEALMFKTFPDAYPNYAKRVKRLIPFIY